MLVLNEMQHAAVTAQEGPALVLAGAGSGKTCVIIERMAYLVEERGVPARNLLALTFTNKAAGEMRTRFSKRIEAESSPAYLGTFHSFGLWVLRREAPAVERPKNFIIFDDADQLSLMKRLVKELPKTFAPVSPRTALGYVSRLKQIDPYPNWSDPPESNEEESCRELWTRYHDALKRCCAVDFDDLTALTAFLWERFPEICDRYRRRFSHILIDEYQDTNRSQYVIARCLGESGSIFAVGDEDQCIYSWRGANINNILDFARDFPAAQIYRLEQNYRSTPSILDASNALVSYNVNRLGKILFTEQQDGESVRYFFAKDAGEETAFVVQDILRRRLEPGKTAIFYRVHTLARMMEEALREVRIPYIVVGGIKFYSRKEIKDILAYLRLLVNPSDDESLRRILNVPPRGIGETGREQLSEYASLRRISLFTALRESELDESMAPRMRRAAGELADILDALQRQSRTMPVVELVENLLERIGYREFVAQSDEKEFRNRIEVVNEFIVSCKQHDQRSPEGGLAGLLEELALISDVDGWEDAGSSVAMMTCHCAKGLEFDHVFVIGLEEEMFPLQRMDEDADMEEERRLCYVAMTRARKSLTLTAAGQRIVYGVPNSGRHCSRFLTEIGENRLQAVSFNGTAQEKRSDKPKPVTPPPGQDSQAAPRFRMGDAVRHARFGRGVVLYTKGEGPKFQIKIRFESGRVAMFMVDKAPIERIKSGMNEQA